MVEHCGIQPRYLWFLCEKFTFIAVNAHNHAGVMKFYALSNEKDERGMVLKQYNYDR
jgi:hypothetical protein